MCSLHAANQLCAGPHDRARQRGRGARSSRGPQPRERGSVFHLSAARSYAAKLQQHSARRGRHARLVWRARRRPRWLDPQRPAAAKRAHAEFLA